MALSFIRSRARMIACGASLAITLSIAAVLSAPSSYATGPTPIGSCTSTSAPCVQSVTVNGAAVPSGFDWQATDETYTTDGRGFDTSSHVISFDAIKPAETNPDSYNLGAAALTDVWSVTLNMGTIPPRFVWGHASGVTVDRVQNGDGTYSVTITGNPVTISGTCDQSALPWTCAQNDPNEWPGRFSLKVYEYNGYTSTQADDDALYGQSYFNNVAADAEDPQFIGSSLFLQIANRHYLSDGTTPVDGHVEVTIPDAVLIGWLGIPDPSTMTPGSIGITATGASDMGTATVTRITGAAHVVLDGIHFSEHDIKVHAGVIVPTRPTNLKGYRLLPTRLKLTFGRATPRGARISGYLSTCVRGDGKQTLRLYTAGSPAVINGLSRGWRYHCHVLARSKAGYGSWTPWIWVPAH